MTELIVHSDQYLAIDLQRFAATDGTSVDAIVSMHENEAILTTTEGWSAAVSGFSIDLSESFYFQAKYQSKALVL